MYSEKLKQDFFEAIRPNAAVKVSYESFFRELVAPLEEQEQTDLYDMDPEPIYRAIERRGHFNTAAARKDVTRVNTYCRWYGVTQRHEFTAGKSLDITKVDLSDAMAAQLFFAPEDPIRAAGPYTLPNGYLDTVLIVLLWYGFSGQEIAALKDNDLRGDENKMMLCGKKIDPRVYREILMAYRVNDNERGDTPLLRKLNRAGHRLAGPIAAGFAGKTLANHKPFYDKPMTPSILSRSGDLYLLDRAVSEAATLDEIKRAVVAPSTRTQGDWRLDLMHYRKAKRKLGLTTAE